MANDQLKANGIDQLLINLYNVIEQISSGPRIGIILPPTPSPYYQNSLGPNSQTGFDPTVICGRRIGNIWGHMLQRDLDPPQPTAHCGDQTLSKWLPDFS